MKSKNLNSQTTLMLLLLLGLSPSFAAYEIKSYSINNGGHGNPTMKSARYELQSSIAQVDASHPANGNNYQLTGGFWQENTDLIFKNNLD